MIPVHSEIEENSLIRWETASWLTSLHHHQHRTKTYKVSS